MDSGTPYTICILGHPTQHVYMDTQYHEFSDTLNNMYSWTPYTPCILGHPKQYVSGTLYTRWILGHPTQDVYWDTLYNMHSGTP